MNPPRAWSPWCAPSHAGGDLGHRMPKAYSSRTSTARNRRRARTRHACTVPYFPAGGQCSRAHVSCVIPVEEAK
jgi:hypothetical protein